MDKVTLAVKEMYEAYPYPSGTPAIRVANDVRLLLSYVQHARKHTGPLHVLDAGCGRGLGTLGNATLHADINFTGIDINSVGIKHAEKAARERRLTNVKFLQCDLMTLEGLRAPPGGYDVIYSSGVLHHLSDPVAGLKKLAAVLAPHGVISMMLYGRYGRQALYNLIESVDLLAGKSSAIGDKLAVARLLAAQADKTIFKHTYWQDTASVNEVEFVDRCLNVNETSYDIATLWELLAQADLKFVRWHEPADWSLATLVDNEQLRDELLTLSEFEQYQIVERLFSRPSLEFSLCKNMNVPRAEIDINNIGDEILQCYAMDILSVFRQYDMVARYGGEEFAVLLPNTDQEGAMRAFNKVRNKVLAYEFESDKKQVALPTFSAGLAIHKPGEPVKNLIERADDMLYKAKQLGRNRIEFDASYPEEISNTLTESIVET